jgi:hypothetical protein
LLTTGGFLREKVNLANKGNVAIRGAWLSVPLLNSSSAVWSCNLDGSTTTATPPLRIPAGAIMACSVQMVLTQDVFELGTLAPTATVSAANLAAPISSKLITFTMVHNPSMAFTPAWSCSRPTSTGEGRR